MTSLSLPHPWSCPCPQNPTLASSTSPYLAGPKPTMLGNPSTPAVSALTGPSPFLEARRAHSALNNPSLEALELSPRQRQGCGQAMASVWESPWQAHCPLLPCSPREWFPKMEPSPALLPGGPRPVWRAAEALKGCVDSHDIQWFKAPQTTGLSRLACASVWVSQQNICPHRNCSCTVLKAPLWSQESQLGNPRPWKQADAFHICLIGDTRDWQGKDDWKWDSKVCNGGLGCGGCWVSGEVEGMGTICL